MRRGVWEIGGRGWKELEVGGLGGEGMVNEHSDSTIRPKTQEEGAGGGWRGFGCL